MTRSEGVGARRRLATAFPGEETRLVLDGTGSTDTEAPVRFLALVLDGSDPGRVSDSG